MLRYYAMATALVLTLVIGVTAYSYRDLIRIRIKGADIAAPPKPNHESNGAFHNGPFTGDAPWALSALPECLRQQSQARGTLAFLARQIPRGSVAIPVPARLRYADCTIFLKGAEALVVRGSDRFRIPPRVRFYRSPKGLVVERTEGGHGDVRVYLPPRL